MRQKPVVLVGLVAVIALCAAGVQVWATGAVQGRPALSGGAGAAATDATAIGPAPAPEAKPMGATIVAPTVGGNIDPAALESDSAGRNQATPVAAGEPPIPASFPTSIGAMRSNPPEARGPSDAPPRLPESGPNSVVAVATASYPWSSPTSNYHTCALTAAGAVKCWGPNESGQLGNSTYADSTTPVDVSTLSSGVASIVTGANHSCALTTAGGVKCWGSNSWGQIGDGTWNWRSAPVDVTGLTSGVLAVTAGAYHTCALITGGALKCWGYNTYGQLGDGTTSNRNAPVDVTNASNGFAGISAGGVHTCAVTSGGGVKCWGYNSYGQVGDGTTTSRSVATDVSGAASGFSVVASGGLSTCAITTGGGLKCWGYNNYGQLGDTTTFQRTSPVPVSGLVSGVISVSLGSNHTCATLTGGALKCWGSNSSGQIGDGTTTTRSTPTTVSGLSSVAVVAAGDVHSCAATTDGRLHCWGGDGLGQLGDTPTTGRLLPGGVQGVEAATLATSAAAHTCVATGTGMQCWGLNSNGQLGNGTMTNRTTPGDVPGIGPGVAAIGARNQFTCTLTSAGGVKCWGYNGSGQLGDGTTTAKTTPADVAGLASGVTALAVGPEFACALTTAGGVKCWGGNWNGELGDGTTTSRSVPGDVTGLTSGVVAIGAGGNHGCAVMTAGTIKCWGWNGSGQLGDSTTTRPAAPVDVVGISSGTKSLALGSNHSCALATAGTVKCWGSNWAGQLGDGTWTQRTTPVDVVGLGGVATLTAGSSHTCGITSGGNLQCWGWNQYGQLGDGTTSARWAPTAITGLAGAAAAIGAGDRHTCAVLTSGAVQCWGSDANGQLGSGRALFRPFPAELGGFGSALATVTPGNSVQIYDGTAKATTVATTPPGLAVTTTYTGIGDTTYAQNVTAPSAAGTYLVVAVVSDAAYVGSGSGTLVINNAAPTVASISPSSAPDYSFTPVTITGTNFMPGVSVRLNGALLPSTFVNSTTLTAVVPPGAAGVAAVFVRNPEPTSGNAASNFAYLAYPRITSLAPASGPAGTSVTITGTNFSDTDAAVSFGGQAAAVTSRSATQIVATVPGGTASGLVDVTVTNVALGRSRTYTRAYSVGTARPGVAGAIAAGGAFSCAVTSTGGVQCWGSNGANELGDGTTVSRSVPAAVSGLTSGMAGVTAGSSGSHGCALTTGGGVKCWGQNGYGQLGDGTTTSRSMPVDVVSLPSGIVAVTASGSHTCALTMNGGVKCWGRNMYGEVGDNTTTDRSSPTDVVGLANGVRAIGVGLYHSCAVLTDGNARCWGRNNYGQLGDGTTTDRPTPVVVQGWSGGAAVVVGGYYHTCAITSSGVSCWGYNSSGQLGDGSTTNRTAPGAVSGLAAGVTALAAGGNHTCAVATDGTARCWGSNPAGQLGDGTTTNRSTPVSVSGLAASASAVAGGSDHTCALLADGGVQCWGNDVLGGTGSGTTVLRTVPGDVSTLATGGLDLTAGMYHACALTSGGVVKCWGSNISGQLGDGTTVSRALPAAVIGLQAGIRGVAAGMSHACAITSGGGVKCWGQNSNGQLGDGTTTMRFTQADVTGLTSGVSAVTAGSYHTCALTSSGGVKCWGSNSSGQLGDNTTTQRSAPVDVSGLTSGVIGLTAGYSHTCALMGAGGMKCWGSNSYGQLGDGTTTQRLAPVDVSGLAAGVGGVAAGAGANHTCAWTTGGALKCWGANSYAQVGDGSYTNRTAPVDVTGLSNGVSAVAASAYHTCALTSGGGVKCWGSGQYGAVGDGSTTTRLTPVDVVNLSSGVTSIAAGSSYSCAVTGSGGIQCWGDNSMGQLGDGRPLIRLYPSNASGYGAIVILGNLDQTYDGTPKAVTAATVPPGLAVTITYRGTGTTTYGPTTAAPTDPGWYVVVATVNDSTIAGSGSAGATLTINNAVPVVSSVAPPSGPDFGGTLITVSGTGFRPGATVQINGLAAAGVYVNATTMTAVTPSSAAAGAATVTVRNPDPTPGAATTTFTYLAYPAVTGIAPASGTAGTAVTITGRNFASDVATVFGSSTGPVTNASATQIVATVPSGLSPGPVDLTVVNVTLGQSRTYQRAFTIGTVLAGTANTVAGGGSFTCAVTSTGGVQCWGDNSSGQLGDGTTMPRGTPTDVPGLTAGMKAVVAGYRHSCALTSGGGVLCWGDNNYGQLGDGTTKNRVTPVDVAGLGGGVVALAGGSNHTCAITNGGGVKCWGSNSYGQLGDGTTTQRMLPVDVPALLAGITGLTAGTSHTCAVTGAGAVQCWGYNNYGQLGDGTTTNRSTPVGVVGLATGVTAVAGGNYHSCALAGSGAVMCWGQNFSGQLGDGTTTGAVSPVAVAGLASDVAGLTAGSSHTCAFTAGGAVQCWGSNTSGQLGDSTLTNRPTPVTVVNLAGAVAALDAGDSHTCATIRGGGVQCWGSNAYGQLGDSSVVVRTAPADVATSVAASALAVGGSHACRLVTGGVQCWGLNSSGQLGDYTTISRSLPANVVGMTGASGIAAGGSHSCATTASGGVKCWGSNSYGQVGIGSTGGSRSTPSDVVGLSDAALVGAGSNHTCALTASGAVTCWGYNNYGQLGDGSATNRSTPVAVSGLASGATALAAGGSHTCAVTAGGGVKCWGYNSSGQLGDASTTSRSTPVDVTGLASGVVGLAAGYSHTCALTSSGGVKCWGSNYYGQLGDGSTTTRTTPVDVTSLASGVTAIGAGYYHTCAITTGGGAQCWGQNSSGQLGDGSLVNRSTPVDATGLTSGVLSIGGGSSHSCALVTGGGVKCWGNDSTGQLGSGRALLQPAPADAAGYGASVTLSNLVQTYDGTPKSAAVGTTPTGLTVAVTYLGIDGTMYGPTTTPPTDGGTYLVMAKVADAVYSGSGSATLIVYNPIPAIATLTPSSGPDAGGTTITISGAGFRPGVLVQIGGLTAAGVYVNDTTMTATAPSSALAGIVDVFVRNAEPALPGRASSTFTYLAYPRITSLLPGFGIAGTVVTITGANFSNTDAAVTFGSIQAAVSSRSVTQVVVTVPSGLPLGPADVTIANVAQGRGRTYARLFTVGPTPVRLVNTVAVGTGHVCATSASGVKCWGDNDYGQLGDGTTTTPAAPVDVVGLGGGVTAVAAGGDHTCALTSGGGVRCWGYNYYGQLGNGTTTNQSLPVDVVGLSSGVVAIAAGYSHTCALTSGGAVKCWGYNSYGQLGDGSLSDRSVPADVAGLTVGAVGVTAGYYHNCAVTGAGAVKCWGNNTNGQLGDGTATRATIPVAVLGLTGGVRAAAAGYYHTCAITDTGGKCWGDNTYGQVGDGTTVNRWAPVDVPGLAGGLAGVAAGYYHTCVLASTGGVQCWGRNQAGQLGDGTTTDRGTPGGVSGVSGASMVAAGYYNTCVAIGTGTVRCWGGNSYRQLADGSPTMRLTPSPVAGVSNATSKIASGYSSSCVITGAGAVQCWGANNYGQLGNGTFTDCSTAATVTGISSGASAIAAGGYRACAVTGAGGAKCWGSNTWGALGTGVLPPTAGPVPSPADVVGLTSGVVSLAAGSYHTCALTQTGGVKCWGRNTSGEVDATTSTRYTPVDVAGLTSGVVALAAGYSHVCAIMNGGAVKCWGSNGHGELGNGATTNSSSPVAVSGLSNGVTALVAGDYHTCALTTGGGVKCWGANAEGELGDGTNVGRLTPADVVGLDSGVTAIGSRYEHTCAVRNGGTLCWGYNNHGQLGDGTTTDSWIPVSVAGLSGGVVGVTCGMYHSCAVKDDGTAMCWGYDANGQLGDGRLVYSAVPLEIAGLGKTAATVALDNLTQVFDGSSKAATVTTTPAGLAVIVTYTGVGGTTYGRTSAPPTLVGTYSVVAMIDDANYSGSAGGTLTIGLGSAPAITDDPLLARTARVKAIHFNELRTAIDKLRAGHGLSAAAWTDQPLVGGVTPVKAIHLAELRTALAEVYTAAGREAPAWNPTTITARATVITAAQITEVRQAVMGIW
ncbi:MAG TPA: IPT/TIG domain-containing protein [Vicinamibacterales bacterium]|jgi:alpha-tubulin suppressor-like RCC1 family protein